MEGIWGPVTATLDWCEANYQFSRYIAEMANTLSNLYSIGLALFGVITAQNESLPTRYTIGSLGFTFVGVGSFAFHATMLYQAQLADEIPMIFVASYACFILFDTKDGFGPLSRRSLTLVTALINFNILFVWSYIIYRNPVYHQVLFSMLMLITIIRIRHLLRSDASRRLPEEVKSSIATTFAAGTGLFALGFLIWNLDNIFCTALTRQKVVVGWPVAFLLEGHAWWHILTGTGTQMMLIGITYVTLCVKDDYRKYRVAYRLGIPYIERIPKTKAI
jgi:dihydroceramidase